MRSIKILVIALFVGLGGATYAMGGAQNATNKGQTAKASCCAAHTQDAKQATHSCDMTDGKGCCTGAGGCCAAHKSVGATAASTAAQGAKKEGGCCGGCKSHRAGYVQLSSSRAKGAAAAKSGCCGNDCCKAHERGSDKESAGAPQRDEGHSCCDSCGSGRKPQVARK